MEELEEVLFGKDRATDVFMNKAWCNLEAFGENRMVPL
jgi:hypothetical protein